MLINEVLDSKSIALSATENASNQIPYLGLQWFPERKKQGLDLSWIKTHKGLPVSLALSNFDTIPTIRAREGLSKEKTQMAFFREGMTVGEEEMLEIERIQSEDDPYCLERSNNIDSQSFIDFYESKGWMIGKNKMKDWKAAVRVWERSRKQENKENVFDEWRNA